MAVAKTAMAKALPQYCVSNKAGALLYKPMGNKTKAERLMAMVKACIPIF